MTEHFDQAVNAETVDLAAHEIADSRLGHAQPLRCGSLGQTAGLDSLRQLNHEVGPGSKILGLFGREAEIPIHITRRAAGSGSHLVLLCSSAEACDLREPLLRQIDVRLSSPAGSLFEGMEDVDRLRAT